MKYRDAYLETTLEVFGDTPALRRLIPFGTNTSRTDICWDPSRTTANGEMAICFYNHEMVKRANVGADLKEVVKYYKPKGR